MTSIFERSEIAARMIDTPLLVAAAKAEALLAAFGGRLVSGGVTVLNAGAVRDVPEAEMGVVGDRLGRTYERYGVAPYDIVDKVAVITIEGTLVQKGAWIGAYSGVTSYQGIQAAVNAARRSTSIRGVVFEVDSFGGQVSGAFDTAAMIAELSAEKPTMSILTDSALSAGYLLASQARQVVMPPDGRAGSIGAVIIHQSVAKALEQAGIEVTILRSGEHKMRGNPFERLPPELADRLRGELDEIRERFAETVAEARGRRITKKAAMETEADFYQGEDALKLGLVDAVGRPAEAFAEFVAAVGKS